VHVGNKLAKYTKGSQTLLQNLLKTELKIKSSFKKPTVKKTICLNFPTDMTNDMIAMASNGAERL